MNNIKNTTNNDFETKWIKLPYLGDKGDQPLKSLKTKSLELYSPLKNKAFALTWKIRYSNWLNLMLFTSLIDRVVMIVN